MENSLFEQRLEFAVQSIYLKATEIIEKITYENIEVYQFLQHTFSSCDVTKNFFFQFVFKKFYKMSEAFLPEKLVVEYFKIMESQKVTPLPFAEIILQLSKIKNGKDQESIQFSFVSKMIHTVDPSNVIYDKYVGKAFGYGKIDGKDIVLKIKEMEARIRTISLCYNVILANETLNEILEEFDKKFSSYQLSKMKKLDFIFWVAGRLIEKEEKDNSRSRSVTKIKK